MNKYELLYLNDHRVILKDGVRLDRYVPNKKAGLKTIKALEIL